MIDEKPITVAERLLQTKGTPSAAFAYATDQFCKTVDSDSLVHHHWATVCDYLEQQVNLDIQSTETNLKSLAYRMLKRNISLRNNKQ